MNKKKILYFFIYLFLFSFLILPLWLNKKFGLIYFEQFKFNLTLLYYGFLDGDSKLIDSAIKWIIIIPIILSIILIYVQSIINFFCLNKDKSVDLLINKLKFIKKHYYKYKLNKLFILINFLLNKMFVIILITLTFILFYLFTNFFKKPNEVSKVDYLDLNYVYPDVYSNGNNNNLVLLYVESLESTFSNKSLFKEDLIKEISSISEGESVEYFYQIPGLGYTFSSLISTQCGVPLLQISKSYIESKDLRAINKFLPNLTCLTDILAKHDYENIFVTSDYLKNSLTDKFLLSHNYTQLYGLKELTKLGYKTSKSAYHNKNEWSGGIHDNILLDASFDILKNQIKNKRKNFFISIMTLDTHSPAGTPNPDCLKSQLNKRDINNYTYKESFKCTSSYVGKFIKEFHSLKLPNTKLIILGDHLLMKDIKYKERYIYNRFFLDDKLKIKRNFINFFDFYPSILEVMNFKINNKKSKVALGYSVFKENHDYEFIDFTLKGSSNLYDTFWYKIDE